jgi:hypothetical protein
VKGALNVRIAGGAAACCLGLCVYLIYGRGYVTSDPMYSLAWGHQLLHGRLPTYTPGPTPHPLSNAVATGLAVAGAHADYGLLAISYLSLGVLACSTWSIASSLAGAITGIVAVVLLLTRELTVTTTSLAYLDGPYTALVVTAVAVEVRRPRSGAPVMILLALAGLLRPEAWVMSGLYWLWLVPRLERAAAVRLALVGVSAPLIWVLCDLLVTGDPLFSLTGTTNAARSVTVYGHGPAAAIKEGPRAVGVAARPAVAVSAIAGMALLLAFRRREGLRFTGLLAGVTVATFAPVFAGTLVNPRYFLVLVALPCVLAGVAVGGWWNCRSPIWAAASALSVLVLVVTAVNQDHRLRNVRERLAATRASYESVRSVVSGPLPCRPLVVPNGRLRPFAAVWRDADLSTAVDGSRHRVARGAFVLGTPAALFGVVVLPGRATHAVLRPPPAARPVRSSGGWTLYSGC